MKNIFIHLGLILILIGSSIIIVDRVSASINDYCSDVDKSKDIIENVSKNYDEFKTKSIIIKDGIVEVSKSFNIYLEDFSTVNVDILNKVNNVEKNINDLNTITDNLINYCDYELNDAKMNNQCSSFKINFNNMIDSYEEMIEVYNGVINTYNDYSKQNGKDTIELYKSNLDSSIVMASTKLK